MRIIVTGANSGVGEATAAALAQQGHSVVIACRDTAKGEAAAARMTGDVSVGELDLADLASVRRFAAATDDVDVLINNAGVMGLPLTRTADGFEMHMGVNHLGHFALTCLLGGKIRDRVISVASATYLIARLHLDDLNWHTRPYRAMTAYGESKLANLLFVAELARRGGRAYATDPGATDTQITRSYSQRDHTVVRRLLHTPAQGARASLQAVTTDAPSGSYLAPRFNQFGRPKLTTPRPKARDPQAARRLWALSAELTGCDWVDR
ncbi:SDR family NAD(P)-dependent oxidoreductase [Mycobacterium sp. MYCO198283]|uniref:SDR family NAD(P)-dependent oxidoreductase n=1 Tax=Mycobacterium sp. MYCO198283 TaxID=2883505 RepID=UPI001E40D1DB|nr:SDR family NAD(P)-dependent oxidoreductase [Mycobacterium sp. MYCO198283]MCG5433649.1 SDR family NAD(P)-dependent oxidoreductase [Mycobacterium sp. MYCO198283]